MCTSIQNENLDNIIIIIGKSGPVTGREGPWGLRDVEAPTFCADSRLIDGGKVVSLRAGRPLPPRKIPETHIC
jgi:hypothetical protein